MCPHPPLPELPRGSTPTTNPTPKGARPVTGSTDKTTPKHGDVNSRRSTKQHRTAATHTATKQHRHGPTTHRRPANLLLRKEVIQPHLPVRLPCYDFVPIASPTFDGTLPQGVRPPASGVADFRDVTGGVYKARERIHRSVADLRLLATPTSWGRVADPNPNLDRLFGIRSALQHRSPLYRPL